MQNNVHYVVTPDVYDGILSRKYSITAAVPLAKIAVRGVRKGFPFNSRWLKKGKKNKKE